MIEQIWGVRTGVGVEHGDLPGGGGDDESGVWWEVGERGYRSARSRGLRGLWMGDDRLSCRILTKSTRITHGKVFLYYSRMSFGRIFRILL